MCSTTSALMRQFCSRLTSTDRTEYTDLLMVSHASSQVLGSINKWNYDLVTEELPYASDSQASQGSTSFYYEAYRWFKHVTVGMMRYEEKRYYYHWTTTSWDSVLFQRTSIKLILRDCVGSVKQEKYFYCLESCRQGRYLHALCCLVGVMKMRKKI